jgi:hypothetical protein
MALRSVPRACLPPTEGPRNVVGADEALSQQTGLPQSKGTRAGARARAESAPSWAGRPPPPPPPPLPPTGLAHISLSLSPLSVNRLPSSRRLSSIASSRARRLSRHARLAVDSEPEHQAPASLVQCVLPSRLSDLLLPAGRLARPHRQGHRAAQTDHLDVFCPACAAFRPVAILDRRHRLNRPLLVFALRPAPLGRRRGAHLCLDLALLDTRPASLAPAVGLPAAGACTAAAVGGPDAADESREELDARQELGQRRGEQQKGRLPERLQRSVSLLLTRAWLALSDDEPVCGRAGGSSDADLAFDGCWQTCLGAARRRRSASPMIRCISPTSASTTTPESVRPRRLPLCAGWRPGVGMAVGPKMPGRRTSSV